MFATHPLSYEAYAQDIQAYQKESQREDKQILARELKYSCTNVMLQCLKPQDRCIFILGTMFKADSRQAAEILNLTPEAYRQRLSRARRKMADFMSQYCYLASGRLPAAPAGSTLRLARAGWIRTIWNIPSCRQLNRRFYISI